MRNHLFIGLGGQGGRTLSELRKVMKRRSIDTAALDAQNVMIKFLAIDSSQDVRNDKRCWSYFGTDLSLNANDWLMLKPLDHKSIAELSIRSDIAPWLGDRSYVENFISQGSIEGANQRRRFGRLLFANNANDIRCAIFTNKVGELIENRPNQCAFHIFATLGGGTGSGCLLDLVATIRDNYPGQGGINQFPIFVYVYVTDNDEGGDVGYFFQNQYASIVDLNAIMSDRLYPHLLGEGMTRDKYAGSEPIAQLIVTTSLNSNNTHVNLETQIQTIAEACLERIYAWSSGQMGIDAQRAITGQDILSTFPGEPMPPNIERTYRFAGFGMRRWEIPHNRLKELIALDLLSSGLRQMLFNQWEEERGYTEVFVSSGTPDVQNTVSSLLNILELEITPKPNVEMTVDRMKTELQQKTDGRKIGITDGSVNLNSIEEAHKEYIYRSFMGSGIDAFIEDRKANLKYRAKKAINRFAEKITELWSNDVEPLPLFIVPLAISGFQDKVKAKRRAGKINEEEIRKRMLRIEARREEWKKLTFLSKKVLGRACKLIDAHARDCIFIHEMYVRKQFDIIEEAFVNELLRGMVIMLNQFEATRSDIILLLKKTEHEFHLIFEELKGLQHAGSANKYEFEKEEIEYFLRWMRNDFEHQRNAAHRFRMKVLEHCGQSQPLSMLSIALKKEETSLEENLRRVALEQAWLIHQDFEIKGEGTPILGGVLLDRLRSRFQHNNAELMTEAKKFLDHASVCLHLLNDTQPVTILGAGQNVPYMPKRLLILGLPRHAYAQNVQRAFMAAQNAGGRFHFDTYIHDDPTQIRLLMVDYWLAARFASVLRMLKDRYQLTGYNTQTSDAVYFCNIDADGEAGRRPSLFLPSAEEMVLRYEAELWLGRQPDISVVIDDENGVFVVYNRDEGASTVMLGNSLEDAISTADHGKMFNLHARITEALDGFKRERMMALLSEHSKNIEKEHGLTSPEYNRWEKLRVQLRKLVQ